MSCYVVSDNSINALVDGFERYGVSLETDYKGYCGVLFEHDKVLNAIGQKLLDMNYASVNRRYDENTEPREYIYKSIGTNDGDILGCINEYEYNTCEVEDYYCTDIHVALMKIKEKMLERYINEAGYKIGYGLD